MAKRTVSSPAEKPKTRAELEARIVDLEGQCGFLAESKRAVEQQLGLARVQEKETRAQIADLKERLSNAENENQRMRGYIARVQEDDVVREELVITGDPDGEHKLAPKRKHQLFPEPSVYSTLAMVNGDNSVDRYINERQRPKHWVTY